MKKHTIKIIFIIFVTVLVGSYFFYNAFGSVFLQNKPKSLTDGLVGHWTFDGADMINNVADSSGQGNTGYLNGTFATATSTVRGKIGQALDFNGVDDYVSISSIASDQGTISVWVKPDFVIFSADTYRIVDGAAGGNLLYLEANTYSGYNTYNFLYRGGYDSSIEITANTYTSDADFQQWTHVVATWDKDGDFRIFRNGVQEDSSVTTSGSLSISSAFAIGAVNGGGREWDGTIDDVRIYNRVLSQAEITRLYNIGVGSKTQASQKNKLTDGLVGYWTFDGPDMINNVADVSGNGNTGYLNGQIATSTIIGKVGQALDFSESSDYVETTNLSQLDSSSELTVCSWVNLNTIGTTDSADDGAILSRDTNNRNNQILFWYNVNADGTGDHTYSFDVGDTFVASNRINGTIDIAVAGKWQYICGVMNGTYRGLYVDGTLNASRNDATQTTVLTSTANARIGGWSFSTNFNLNGKMDDVRVYSKALSASEIKRLYNMGR
jgi:hypothetical protein